MGSRNKLSLSIVENAPETESHNVGRMQADDVHTALCNNMCNAAALLVTIPLLLRWS